MGERKLQDEEALCRRVAYIMGEHSGAAQAIRCLEQKRAEGLGAFLWFEGNRWLVGFVSPDDIQGGTHG